MSPRTVVTSSVVPLPAAEVVARLHRSETLRFVCWPLLTFPPDLPATLTAGESLSVRLSVAGVVPLWTHRLTVIESTDGGLLTEERGGPVRSWRHRLTVEPVDARRSFYRDEVVIDAGPLSTLVAAVAGGFYRWRHRRWARLASAARPAEGDR